MPRDDDARLEIALRDLQEILDEAAYHQARVECADTPPAERLSAGAQLRYYGQIASRKRAAIARLKGQTLETP